MNVDTFEIVEYCRFQIFDEYCDCPYGMTCIVVSLTSSLFSFDLFHGKCFACVSIQSVLVKLLTCWVTHLAKRPYFTRVVMEFGTNNWLVS